MLFSTGITVALLAADLTVKCEAIAEASWCFTFWLQLRPSAADRQRIPGGGRTSVAGQGPLVSVWRCSGCAPLSRACYRLANTDLANTSQIAALDATRSTAFPSLFPLGSQLNINLFLLCLSPAEQLSFNAPAPAGPKAWRYELLSTVAFLFPS